MPKKRINTTTLSANQADRGHRRKARSRGRPPARFRFVLAALFAGLIPAAPAQADTVREGDSAPDIGLRSEEDRPIRLHSPERATVMTFIFTRCAAMEFCPKMNANFEALQDAIREKDLSGKVRLLSITLDPEYDRPERLKKFGRTVGADPEVWHFATGTKEQIDGLTGQFRVFRENKDGVLNHTLCTALVRPDGTVEKIWRGNFWKPGDVLAEIR